MISHLYVTFETFDESTAFESFFFSTLICDLKHSDFLNLINFYKYIRKTQKYNSLFISDRLHMH